MLHIKASCSIYNLTFVHSESSFTKHQYLRYYNTCLQYHKIMKSVHLLLSIYFHDFDYDFDYDIILMKLALLVT